MVQHCCTALWRRDNADRLNHRHAEVPGPGSVCRLGGRRRPGSGHGHPGAQRPGPTSHDAGHIASPRADYCQGATHGGRAEGVAPPCALRLLYGQYGQDRGGVRPRSRHASPGMSHRGNGVLRQSSRSSARRFLERCISSVTSRVAAADPVMTGEPTSRWARPSTACTLTCCT